MDETNGIGADVEEQINQQGAALYRVKDGEVLVLTTKTLEHLLAKSIESGQGRVILFVKGRAQG